MAGLTGPLASARSTPLRTDRDGDRQRHYPHVTRVRRDGHAAAGQCPAAAERRGSRPPTRAGPDGARVRVSGGDGVTYYWPSGRIRVDGLIETQGGGLPMARVQLNQPRGGGPMSGEARIAPYSVGGARLALAPVRFPRGERRLDPVARSSCSTDRSPGGRVRGLRIPINGRFGGQREDSLSAAAASKPASPRSRRDRLRLGPTRCRFARSGRRSSTRPGRRIDGHRRSSVNRPRLAGRLGHSPVA